MDTSKDKVAMYLRECTEEWLKICGFIVLRDTEEFIEIVEHLKAYGLIDFAYVLATTQGLFIKSDFAREIVEIISKYPIEQHDR